jgi:hypothetical protein
VKDEKTRDDKILTMVCESVDQDVATLPPHIAERLRQGRLRALAQGERKRWHLPLPWLTVGGAATLSMLLLSVILWQGGSQPMAVQSSEDELEMVAAQDHLALYEDLEFYQWLAAGDGRR